MTDKTAQHAARAPELTPVIVGAGERVDRPAELSKALEPVALMAEALRAAERDAGTGWLHRLDTIDVVGLVSWRYENPVALLCERLGIDPARKTNASMGGETPIRLIHEAAAKIARGEITTAAIVGGEAANARSQARKAKEQLDWTPLATPEATAQFAGSRYPRSDLTKKTAGHRSGADLSLLRKWRSNMLGSNRRRKRRPSRRSCGNATPLSPRRIHRHGYVTHLTLPRSAN